MIYIVDYLIFEIIFYSIISNNNFRLLADLRCVSKQIKNTIDNDRFYIRKKYAFILKIVIDKIDIRMYDIMGDYYNNNDFKYLLNCFYNIATDNDITYNKYIQSIELYKKDRLDPLKRLPEFKYHEIKQRMKSSIMLKLALMHAGYEYSFAKAREIDDFY
tara:strand:- start:43 stop:522 length:480 start_codon:yes stop_codon:yes gene_type:complete